MPRAIIATAEEYANVTWPANANATLAFSAQAFVGCIIGVPANIFVILLSFFSSKVVGDYKFFIANLAFCDLMYCCTLLFGYADHLYHRLGDVLMNVEQCYVEAGYSFTAGFCLAFALPLPSINRYIAIVLQKDDWFEKKRTILLLCLTSYIPIIYRFVTLSVLPSNVVYYPACNFSYNIPYVDNLIYVYIIFFIYPAIIFCNFRIYRVLAQHTSSTTAILNKTAAEVDVERSILKAIMLQGAAPVFTAFPLGMCVIVAFFLGWNIPTVVLFRFSDDMILTLFDVSICVFATTPTIDAVIDLVVVKQYRRGCKDVFSRFKHKFGSEITPVTPSNLSRQNQ